MTDHHPHRLADVSQVTSFMFAGNATLTIVSVKTGNRFTYRVRRSEDGRVFFVALLSGSDNEDSFQYLGHWRGPEYVHGRKSKIGEDAPAAKAYAWFAANFQIDGALDLVEVWHEGRCGRCGRKLTVPESIESGFGPECAGKGVNLEAARELRKEWDAQHGATIVPLAGRGKVSSRGGAKRVTRPQRASLRAGEAAQSPDGKPAAGEGKVLPFPNDSDWVGQWARGEVTL